MFKMFKKICSLLCLVLFTTTSAVFAQSAPVKVLSAKDVSAFITNFKTIQKDFYAMGDKYEDFFDSDFDDSDNPVQALAHLRTLKVPAEIQSVLKKNGMGDKGFEKFIVITMGVSVLYMIDTMEEQKQNYATQPEMQPYMTVVDEMIQEMRGSIHEADLALLKPRLPELIQIIGDDTDDDDYDDYDDYDFD